MAALFFHPFLASAQLLSLLQPVRISWAASKDASVTGYNLYFGMLGDNDAVQVNVGKNLQFSLPALMIGSPYFFYVTAYDKKGVESDPSEVKVYTPVQALPDLSVSSAFYTPGVLWEGTRAQFRVMLRNRGNGAVPAGTKIRVQFVVDGKTSGGWVDYSGGLEAGSEVYLTAGEGIPGTAVWTATAGFHIITVVADYAQILNEHSELNNQFVIGSVVLPKLSLFGREAGENPPDLSTITSPLPDEGVKWLANPDSDGDGMADTEEFIAGTDPNEASSALRILSLEPGAAGALVINWQSVPGINYQVFAKELTPGADWKPVSSALNAEGALMSCLIPEPSVGDLFRVGVVQVQGSGPAFTEE